MRAPLISVYRIFAVYLMQVLSICISRRCNFAYITKWAAAICAHARCHNMGINPTVEKYRGRVIVITPGWQSIKSSGSFTPPSVLHPEAAATNSLIARSRPWRGRRFLRGVRCSTFTCRARSHVTLRINFAIVHTCDHRHSHRCRNARFRKL